MLVGDEGVAQPVEVVQGQVVPNEERGELAGEGDVLEALEDDDAVVGRGLVRLGERVAHRLVELVGAVSEIEGVVGFIILDQDKFARMPCYSNGFY